MSKFLTDRYPFITTLDVIILEGGYNRNMTSTLVLSLEYEGFPLLSPEQSKNMKNVGFYLS